jgi:UDP-N-acetylglucosamine transferase subunit ALG13
VTALVLALMGTDHHPFDRMVQWIDAAAVRHHDAHFVIQHGVTRPPLVAEGHGYLDQDTLAELLARATVVVCHGGPGTIIDARDAGHVPLCVPRDPALGEHVDGHQQRFAALIGAAGIVRAINSPAAFERELARALVEDPAPAACVPTAQIRDAARALAAAELNDLMTAVRPGILGRQRRARL